MAKLKVNENKVIRGTGHLGRFLGGPVKLGHVYRRDGHDLNFYESIMDDILAIHGKKKIPKQWVEIGPPKDIKFIGESGVNVKLGASASGAVGSGKAHLAFSRNNTAFISLKNAVYHTLAIGEIQAEIREVWEKKGYDKKARQFVLVTEVIRAESGTVIFSMKRNNSIEIQAKSADVPLVDIEPAAEGGISIVSSRSAYLEVISNKPFEPLFGAIRVKKNGDFKGVD